MEDARIPLSIVSLSASGLQRTTILRGDAANEPRLDEVENNKFLAEQRDEFSRNPETDLNCNHFSRCSGCIIDVGLDQPPIMKEAKARFARCGVRSFSLAPGPVVEWRCRAKSAVCGTPEDPQIGLYEEGTHSIVDIPSCRSTYQMVVTTLNTSIPSASRYAAGEVQISTGIVWNARDEDSVPDDKLSKMAEMLWRRGNPKSVTPILHSVWAKFQTSRTNVIFGGRWRHLVAEPELWERVGGVDIAFTPTSFGQANTQAFEALLRRLQKVVKTGSKVVELYAGVGAIGLSLAAVRKYRWSA